MKKILILLSISTIAIFVVYSCQKNNDSVKTENARQNLSLISPQGKVLATSIEDLKSQMNPQIFRKFNSVDVAYTITNISYTSTKSGGMIADVMYWTKDGNASNIVFMVGVKEKVNAHGNVKMVIEDKYSQALKNNVAGLTQQTKHSYSCSGGNCCSVHAVEHPDGSVDVDCSCSGCSMTID